METRLRSSMDLLMFSVLLIVITSQGRCAPQQSGTVASTTGIKRECGSYAAVFPEIGVRVRDISENLPILEETGGVAALYHSSRHVCGAALISKNILLTAAHCVIDNERSISISLGRENLNELNVGEHYNIRNVYIHPSYNRSISRYNDIAILETDQEVQYGKNIWPFCLPESNQQYTDFLTVQIAGWGLVNQTHTSTVLRTAFLKLVENSRCDSIWRQNPNYENVRVGAYPQGFTEQLLCAERRGVDSCQGDSGGPMSHQNSKGLQTVIGLVAGGIGSCAPIPDTPGFYTNIANYIDWIYDTTGIPRPSLSSTTPVGPSHLPIIAISGLDMFKAAERGDLASVKNDLASGINANWRNPDNVCPPPYECIGQTALHVAAFGNHPAVIQVLLAAGADKNVQDFGGRTPVYRASYYGNTDALTTLIDHGADIHILTDKDWTPLHGAAINNHLAVVKQLLRLGADPRKINTNGRTPADVARHWRGHHELANFLDNFTGSTTA